jgi:hypothetical protein
MAFRVKNVLAMFAHPVNSNAANEKRRIHRMVLMVASPDIKNTADMPEVQTLGNLRTVTYWGSIWMPVLLHPVSSMLDSMRKWM